MRRTAGAAEVEAEPAASSPGGRDWHRNRLSNTRRHRRRGGGEGLWLGL